MTTGAPGGPGTTDRSGSYCTGCGQDLTACPTGGRCRGRYEPPRHCPTCGRRMAVQVTPTSWTARCRDHGPLPPTP